MTGGEQKPNFAAFLTSFFPHFFFSCSFKKHIPVLKTLSPSKNCAVSLNNVLLFRSSGSVSHDAARRTGLY